MNYQTDNLIVYDLEVYKNFFLAGFLLPDGMIVQFEDRELLLKALASMTSAGYELCGFNSNRYDDPVMSEFLNQNSTKAAFDASYAIIQTEVNPWNYNPTYNSVDLMPLLPGRMSLKQIGIRLHHKRLQELPIHWDKELTESDKHVIREYNKNDLYITKKLLDKIRPELELRGDLSRQYGVDLRSKGGPQIAETAIVKTLGRVSKDLKALAKDNKTTYVSISPPSWLVKVNLVGEHLTSVITTQTPRFNTQIPLDENGRLKLPKLSNLYLDDKYYAIGAGGLHSIDGPGCYLSSEQHLLMVIDVTSMYPTTMLNESVYPRHLHSEFAGVYKDLYDARLVAKANGNTVEAEGKKLILNSTFGKLADPYSAFYDPQAMGKVTLYGQVALLVLIAVLADVGVNTVSANTDGILIYTGVSKSQILRKTVSWWETLTGYSMEYDNLSAYYQVDVNNFLQVYK